MHEETVIRGGTVVTALGLVETDLWIANGKIWRWGRDTLKKKRNAKMPIEIDATGMYLLPGFISFESGSPLQRTTGDQYLQAMRKLVKSGCTSFVDKLAVETWMNHSQLRYLQSCHYNSLIDYVWQIGLDAARLTPGEVMKWCRQGYTSIHLTVQHKGNISTIDWETISSALTSYRTMLHLHLPPKGINGKNEREEIRNRWLDITRSWKLRTVVEQHHPVGGWELADPFYQLFLLGTEQTDRGMRTLYHKWYGTCPVAASIQDIVIDNRRQWCDREELLSLLVRLASRNVAKAVGLYPRKGTLAPGADADIIFLNKEIWLTKRDLSTILKFSEIDLPTSVMSNGKWIYRDMSFIPTVGMGRCLSGTRPYSYVI